MQMHHNKNQSNYTLARGVQLAKEMAQNGQTN